MAESFKTLVDCFHKIENTTGKGSAQQSINRLADVFLQLFLLNDDGQTLISALYLSTNAIYPPSEGIELGIGAQIINKCLINLFGVQQK